jgi:hypothetical protein
MRVHHDGQTCSDGIVRLAVGRAAPALAIKNTGTNPALHIEGGVLEFPDGTTQNTTPFPAGAIVAFAAGITPAGWLICEGGAISRSSYPSLFSAIGTTYGSGNGSTTFDIPDFRGRFLRGFGGYSDNFGQAQEDTNRREDAKIMWSEHHGNGRTFNDDWGIGHGSTLMHGWGSGYPDNYGPYMKPVWKMNGGRYVSVR